MTKKKLLIDRSAFCSWYFDDDICEDFFNRHGIYHSLENEGVFKITLKEILNDVGYLPANVVADGQEPVLDENDEVDMSAYDSITFAKPIKQTA